MNNMQNMANMGRYGDSQMAHVAPGEMVVPRQIMQKRPEVAQGIAAAFADEGVDPRRYTVGSPNNSVNPMTGQPEFFWKELLGMGKTFLGSKAGKGAIANIIGRKLAGKKTNLLRDALVGGIGGNFLLDDTQNLGINQFFGGSGGGGAASGSSSNALQQALSGSATNSRPGFPTSKPSMDAVKANAINPVVNNAISSRFDNDKLLGYGEMLNTLAPGLKLEGENSILGKLLGTRGGEALLSGLGAQLLSSLFDKEEPDLAGERARRPFGHGAPTRVNTMRSLAQGGETSPNYYPRRDGGIMPSEGSGARDDVPAMLTAGEFVLTKDAVRGLGNGNQEQGIAKAYNMMNRLEGMA
mgnify:FL=1